MIKNDHDFWGWYTERLVSDSKFTRDVVARKSFSKLRTAIAGLYAARGEMDEAEYAFKQAVELYPLSPEAAFRLADLYMRKGEYEKARNVMIDFGKEDVYNDRVKPTIESIDKVEKMDSRRVELEALINSKDQPVRPENLIELIQVYNTLQKNQELAATVRTILTSEMPPQLLLQFAQQLAGIRRFDLAEAVLIKYLSQKPEDNRIWVEVAALRVALNRFNPALDAIQKAVEEGGPAIRNQLQKDSRFPPLYTNPRFRTLVPPAAPAKQLQFNNLF
jgi:tetratricopeptide (TPR) repeat protein